ncbi:unnamed protein product [Rhizoctonia solani]|uniref:Uncharacterized protein n=1 Tax=Rhizoctonia solani TaxID=456999 RepID=A0A8H3HVN2_9AGAM|nr:unnamed protein product [Rhizoctonia solani]
MLGSTEPQNSAHDPDHQLFTPRKRVHTAPIQLHNNPAPKPELPTPFILAITLRLAFPDLLASSRLLLGALYVISVPLFWGFRNAVRDVMRNREAKRLGARVVPKVKGKWPGNIDLMVKMVKSTRTGYVAEVWDELAKEYGNTFNMRILWDDLASPFSFVSRYDLTRTPDRDHRPRRDQIRARDWVQFVWQGSTPTSSTRKFSGRRDIQSGWGPMEIHSAIQRREEFLKAGGDKTKPAGDTFIDDLVSSTDDRTLITDELVNILLAARDTTASLLTFTTYLLTQHPKVLHRLREEIREHIRPDAAPTYEHIKGMKYLRAILNETLRLFPSVPINERATLTGCSIPTASGPLYVPSGTQVLYSPLLMQRRQDLWGPDAWEFDPERWLDGRNEAFVKDPMRFVPFNAGPRICLGQQFAYNEASFVLVRLFQRFSKLELAMDAAPPGSVPPVEWQGQYGRKGFERVWVKNAITLYSKGGMWVRVAK